MADPSDEDPLNAVAEIFAMAMALEDVVARLVAYESLRHPHGPDALFFEISEGTEINISNVRKKLGDCSPLNIEEGLRKHIDLVLAKARKVLM